MPGNLTQQLAVLQDSAASAESRHEARRQLFDLLYDELHGLAGKIARRSGRGATLQTTTLLHEAFLRLARNEEFSPLDRHHFLATAAMAMRRILVDFVRSRRTAKRGGDRRRVPLDDLADAYVERAVDLEQLDASLQELARVDERAALVVDLHFFGGFTFTEVARYLDVTTRTVRRDWDFARTLLREDLA